MNANNFTPEQAAKAVWNVITKKQNDLEIGDGVIMYYVETNVDLLDNYGSKGIEQGINELVRLGWIETKDGKSFKITAEGFKNL